MTDLEQQILNRVGTALDKSIDSVLTGYNSPLCDLAREAIEGRRDEIVSLFGVALESILDNADARAEIAAAIRSKIAKLLVTRFGGELEKQVNALKANPETRAQITLAIQKIVKESSQ